jgi:4-amino-4-deoxy-L-arabinose transferase-like glycosyltransferase
VFEKDITPVNHDRRIGLLLFAITFVIIVTISSSALFIPKQTLWVDEVTQMSGLTLNPIEVVAWLTGEASGRFEVPPDRMPPLSYWLGWSWSKLFGLTETSLRWFSALISLCAVAIVFTILYRKWGITSATLLALAFGLSPNIVVNSVEIRAYPLFLLFSCGSFFFFIEILKQPQAMTTKHIAGLVFCLILAMYTHFYGVVLAAVLLSVLLLITWQVHGKIKSVIFASGIMGIAVIGLLPFIVTSVTISDGSEVANEARFYLKDTIRLMYRLIGHPTMSMNYIAVGMAFVAITSLLMISLKSRDKTDLVSKGLWLSLILGLIVVTVANFLFFKFNPTTPHYNLWMVVNLFFLLACSFGVTNQKPHLSKFAFIAALMLIMAHTYSISQLMIYSDHFSHGPHRHISAMVQRLGTEQVSVIYEKQNRTWGFVYFPLRYEFKQKLPQYLIQPEPSQGVTVRQLPKETASIDSVTLTTPYLMVVQVKQQDAQAVKQQIRFGHQPMPEGAISDALKKSKQWQRVNSEIFPGFVTAEVVTFKKQK